MRFWCCCRSWAGILRRLFGIYGRQFLAQVFIRLLLARGLIWRDFSFIDSQNFHGRFLCKFLPYFPILSYSALDHFSISLPHHLSWLEPILIFRFMIDPGVSMGAVKSYWRFLRRWGIRARFPFGVGFIILC